MLLTAAPLSLLYLVKLLDPDVWWHLATGRHVIEHHAIPTTDPFSYTVFGHPWTGLDWLSDLLMYASHRLCGDRGPTLLSVAAIFSLLVMLGLTLRELRISRASSIATLTSVALLAQWRWSLARPLTLGAALASVGLYLVARGWARDRSDLNSPRGWAVALKRSVLWFPLLCLIWSAIHPTVVLGAIEISALCVSMWIVGRKDRFAATVAMLLTGAVILIGPGRVWLVHSASLQEAKLATELTIEWRRASLGDVRVVAAAVWVLIGMVGVVGSMRKQLPFVIIAVAGAAAATRFARHSAEAVLLAAPLVGLALDRLAEALQRLRLLRAVLPSLLVLALPILQISLGGPRAFSVRFGLGADVLYRPVQTFAALRAMPSGRVMNDCTFGGWLIWQHVPVYCDGRTVTLYRESDVADLWLPLFEGEAAIDRTAARWGVSYFLARAQSPFDEAMARSDHFVPIAYDRESALYATRRAAGSQLRFDDLRFADDPTWMDAWYKQVFADPARTKRLYQSIVALYRESPDARALIGTMEHLRRGHPIQAAALLDLLSR